MTVSTSPPSGFRSVPPIPTQAVALALFMVSGLVACSKDRPRDRPQTTPPPSAAETYDTLVIGYWADGTLFGPYWGVPARHLVFEPLFKETSRPGEFVPALVTHWEHSEDYKTWTYTIHSGVRWHDGVPLTAQDVKFSFDLSAHPEVFNYSPGSVEARVLNDTTIQVTYLEPDNPTPALSIWPEHLLRDLDPADFWTWEFWSEPVGSGPYRYVRHVDKEMVELEANSDYFGNVPAIEKVIFKFGGNTLADLRAGVIQAVGPAPAQEPEQVAMTRDPDFRTFFDELLSMSIAVYWNHRNPLFQEVSVRRALTMAINRPELVTVLNLPERTRIVDVVVPFFPGGIDPGEALPYDPDAARRLLAEAGWMDEDGDGILERQGRKFHFTAVVGGIVGGWNTEQASVYVQAKLKEVGVQMAIRPLGGARMVRNAIESGEADAAVHRLHFGNLTRAVTQEAYIGFDDQEIRDHFQAADAAWDPEVRRRHLRAGLELVRERMPVTILFPMVDASIAHRRVKGLRSPDRVDPTAWAHELWIEHDPNSSGGPGG